MIPQGIKEKIFALYLGQKMDSSLSGTVINGAWIQRLQEGELDASILVKPLSQITDEDAIYIGKLYDSKKKPLLKRSKEGDKVCIKWYGEKDVITIVDNFWECEFWNGLYYDDEEHQLLSIEYIDYLRSKGYALPAYGYSVEELVKEGIFNL